MMPAVGSALSGLIATQTRVDVAGRNIANADTDGYKKVSVSLLETPQGGVQARADSAGDPGPTVFDPASGGGRAVEKSNVDLAEEMGTLVVAKPLYQANLKVIQTQDEMLGSLLDILK